MSSRRIPAIIPTQALPQSRAAFPRRQVIGAPSARPPQVSAQQRAQPQTAAQSDSARAELDAQMSRYLRAEGGIPNMRAYLMNALQTEDESSVINPHGTTYSVATYSGSDMGLSEEVAADASGEEVSTKLSEIIARIIALKTVDVSWPIGHAAMDDTRIFVDTLQMSNALGGFINGTIPLQFSHFNNISAPDRIVKITILPFSFPHIHTRTSTVFDFFYFRKVYMTIAFIPATSQIQSTAPNELFTMELDVDDIDAQAVTLRPVSPTYTLGRPVSGVTDLSISFRTAHPNLSGFVPCAIPPLRIRAQCTHCDAVYTEFTIVDGSYIGVLAPDAATYQVAVFVTRTTSGIPPTAFEAAFDTGIGHLAYQFAAATSTFRTVTPGGAPMPIGEFMWIIIPKNRVSFTMRFSCTQSTTTNHLIPVHE